MKIIEKGTMPEVIDAVLFNGENCEEVSQLESNPHSGKAIRWNSDTTAGGWLKGYAGDDLPNKSLESDKMWEAGWTEFERGDWIIRDGDIVHRISPKSFERDYEPHPFLNNEALPSPGGTE